MSVGEDAVGCIDALKDALGTCSIKQRLRWLEKMNAAVPDAWSTLKADVSLFQADDIVKEALLGALRCCSDPISLDLHCRDILLA